MSNDKTFHVNTAALVGLKAAVYSKRRDFANEKKRSFANELHSSKQVSEKTSSIWRNSDVSGRKSKATGNSCAVTRQKEESDKRMLSQQEEDALERSRRALEVKAALYDKLSRGEGAAELEEEGEEGNYRYMVDFTKKAYEAHFNESSKREERSHAEGTASTGTEAEAKGVEVLNTTITTVTGKDERDWVEYEDSLGRSRRCLREDLDEMIRMDRDMTVMTSSASSYMQQRRRQRSTTPNALSEEVRKVWEEEEEEGVDAIEVNEPDEAVRQVHYQNVQGGEIRNHGVGYYAFSTDAEMRKEQMELLSSLREKTFSQREKHQKILEKKKALLDARLAKVRQRKLKRQGVDGGGGEDVGMVTSSKSLTDFDFDMNEKNTVQDRGGGVMGVERSEISALLAAELSQAQERAAREEEEREDVKRDAYVRPWDRGKIMDPVRKRKRELEAERPIHFAPPSSYSKSGSGRDSQASSVRDTGPDPLPSSFSSTSSSTTNTTSSSLADLGGQVGSEDGVSCEPAVGLAADTASRNISNSLMPQQFPPMPCPPPASFPPLFFPTCPPVPPHSVGPPPYPPYMFAQLPLPLGMPYPVQPGGYYYGYPAPPEAITPTSAPPPISPPSSVPP